MDLQTYIDGIEDGNKEEESRILHQILRYHKFIAQVYKQEWNRKANDAKSSHTSTTSWPQHTR